MKIRSLFAFLQGILNFVKCFQGNIIFKNTYAQMYLLDILKIGVVKNAVFECVSVMQIGCQDVKKKGRWVYGFKVIHGNVYLNSPSIQKTTNKEVSHLKHYGNI